jgi:O-antigen biosynthesis protein WbqP
MIKRLFDILLASSVGLILLIPLIVIGLIVRLTSKGPAIHWSKRVGQNNQIFLMPKFRSMRLSTPQLATHLMPKSENFITPVGRILRKTSLDELPQLYSVIVGDMSLVGPRPALFNQDDLVELRTQKGIEKLKPGVTGWAQVNGRDDLPIPVKVDFDFAYLQRMSLVFDLKILILTFLKVLKSDGIQH